MNVALIPVRGGSKSIPFKNIRMLAGKPLVYWTARAASGCKDIEKVYIATDSERIREAAEAFRLEKVAVIGRSGGGASDTAPTETVMLEFAEKYEFDNIVLIQATSPLLTSEDLSGGFLEFGRPGTDSVLSVVRQKRFQWKENGKGFVVPVNYDVSHRPRRQEFNGFLVENGAFYITGRKRLLESGSRISGNIRAFEMDEAAYYEIDEPDDWVIVESLLTHRLKRMQGGRSGGWIPEIKMFLTDCDGCLTDGGMYYSEKGDELKRFHASDGMGFQMLREKGILTGIVTAETRELNCRRAEKLHLDIFEEGVQDKAETVRRICREHGVDLGNVAYVGDDVNDLEAIRIVGFGCSVANGTQEVKNAAKYVTLRSGGQGAVRELIDLIVENL